MDHVSDVEIQFEWQHKQPKQTDMASDGKKIGVEIWIIFMQIECINKSIVAFNSIDDVFM